MHSRDRVARPVLDAWVGNTEAIAAKRYLQMTAGHLAKAVQNPVQQPAVLPRAGPQVTLPAHQKNPVLQGFSAGCEVVHTRQVEDRGLEPLTFWLPARRSPN